MRGSSRRGTPPLRDPVRRKRRDARVRNAKIRGYPRLSCGKSPYGCLSHPMSALQRPTITRHRTRIVRVGGIAIGGGAPIVVQSMTNTDTADIAATVTQVKALADAGSELVRIAVNDNNAAAAVPVI